MRPVHQMTNLFRAVNTAVQAFVAQKAANAANAAAAAENGEIPQAWHGLPKPTASFGQKTAKDRRLAKIQRQARQTQQRLRRERKRA